MIKRELKSQKFSFSARPSVLEKAEKLAFLRHYSTNQLLNIVLEEYLAAHEDEVKEFDKKYPNGIN